MSNWRTLVSFVLILITEALAIYHIAVAIFPNQASAALIDRLGIGILASNALNFSAIAGAALILFPATFTVGNLVNAAGVLMMAVYFVIAGEWTSVIVESLFLFIPFSLILLGHPLAK